MKGLWVKLSVDYLDDPKILRVGMDGELLFIRGLAYAKKRNDGFIPEAVLPRIGFGFDLGQLTEIAARLESEGLWQAADNGWTITAWSVWQVDTSSERGGFANHKRWHKEPKPGCQWCESKWTPNGLQMDVQMESREEKSREESFVASADAEQLCDLLKQRMEANGVKTKPVTSAWLKQMDAIIRLDKRTTDEIRSVIEWCQSDPFWRCNILSPKKLREKFETLRLRMGDVPVEQERVVDPLDEFRAKGLVAYKTGASVDDDWVQSELARMTDEQRFVYLQALEHGR